jgi:polyisoprenoid-binding protein YceI
MKKQITIQRNKFYFLSVLFLALLFSGPYAQAALYTVDPQHTYVLWRANHFGFSNPSGKWMAKGAIDFDEIDKQKSKVKITINTTDMITGIPKLDEHLKGKLFFDVKQFPEATFVSDKIELTGNNTATVNGMLTLRGVTKPVSLNVILNKAGVSPVNNKMTMGFSATATLKRSDFGITTLVPGVSDEVSLNIEVEANKSN